MWCNKVVKITDYIVEETKILFTKSVCKVNKT